MAQRLALIGCAAGPWVAISRVRRPAIRVVGLAVDAHVKGTLRMKSGEVRSFIIEKNGSHPLGVFEQGDRPEWLQLTTPNPTPGLICGVIEQAA